MRVLDSQHFTYISNFITFSDASYQINGAIFCCSVLFNLFINMEDTRLVIVERLVMFFMTA